MFKTPKQFQAIYKSIWWAEQSSKKENKKKENLLTVGFGWKGLSVILLSIKPSQTYSYNIKKHTLKNISIKSTLNKIQYSTQLILVLNQ
jgi:hypothetical protein